MVIVMCLLFFLCYGFVGLVIGCCYTSYNNGADFDDVCMFLVLWPAVIVYCAVKNLFKKRQQ